jgi:hypothetical protein
MNTQWNLQHSWLLRLEQKNHSLTYIYKSVMHEDNGQAWTHHK